MRDLVEGVLGWGWRGECSVSLLKTRLLSRATKIRLYKTLIRPAVTYVAETWTVTKKEEQFLLIF